MAPGLNPFNFPGEVRVAQATDFDEHRAREGSCAQPPSIGLRLYSVCRRAARFVSGSFAS